MLSAVRPSRESRVHDDVGTTLVEIMVVMTLMTVIGAMVTGFFVGANRATSRAADDSTTTANSRAVMTAITAMLRLADSPTTQAGFPTGRFATFTASSVVFYSNVNANRSGSSMRSAPTKVSLTAAGTKLTEKLYAPINPYPTDYTTNYPSTPSSSRVLLANLGNTNLFSYCTAVYDAAGNCTAATTAGSIASVTVTLTLTGLPGETTQVVTSTVGVTGALS